MSIDLNTLHRTRSRPVWPLVLVLLWTVAGGLFGGLLGLALNHWWPFTPTESGVLCIIIALGYAVWLFCRKDRA